MSNYPTFYAYLKKKILRFQKNSTLVADFVNYAIQNMRDNVKYYAKTKDGLVFRRNTRSAFGHTPSNPETCWDVVANSTQLATYITF